MADPRSDERWTNITITDPTKEKILTSSEKLSKTKEVHQDNPSFTNKPTECDEVVPNIESENSETFTTIEEIEVAVRNLKLKSKFECSECGAQYEREENLNKYAIYAYTHGPVTGSGPSVKPLKYDVAPYWLS